MTKKIIVAIIVIFIFISTLLYLFSPDFFAGAFGGSKNFWLYTIIIVSFIVSLILDFLDKKYPSEYSEANRTAYTPRNRYGLYALIYFASFFLLFYLYIFLTK